MSDEPPWDNIPKAERIREVMGMARLFAECWATFIDGGQIDPFDLQVMLERTGLCEWRDATEADVEASSMDLEVGDPILCLTDPGRRARELGRMP